MAAWHRHSICLSIDSNYESPQSTCIPVYCVDLAKVHMNGTIHIPATCEEPPASLLRCGALTCNRYAAEVPRMPPIGFDFCRRTVSSGASHCSDCRFYSSHLLLRDGAWRQASTFCCCIEHCSDPDLHQRCNIGHSNVDIHVR